MDVIHKFSSYLKLSFICWSQKCNHWITIKFILSISRTSFYFFFYKWIRKTSLYDTKLTLFEIDRFKAVSSVSITSANTADPPGLRPLRKSIAFLITNNAKSDQKQFSVFAFLLTHFVCGWILSPFVAVKVFECVFLSLYFNT